ncbi:MAG: hypothetical protein LBG62_02375 [Candidatus Methanoplasma sp.]|jgi:hypothetical protein|nr:hypothetical protein [Candidatus Methanoplasma sp.]
MKTKTKLAVASASFCLAICVAAVAMEEYYLLGSAIVALFSSLAMLYSVDDGEGRCRNTAMYLSRVPGLGHVYLGCGRRSIPFFIGDVACASTFALMAMFPADSEFVFFLLFEMMFFVFFASMIDAEMVCDRMGFPRTAGGCGLNLRRGRLCLLALAMAMAILTSASSACVLSGPGHGNNLWLHASIVASTIALAVAMAADYARKRDSPLPKLGCDRGGGSA